MPCRYRRATAPACAQAAVLSLSGPACAARSAAPPDCNCPVPDLPPRPVRHPANRSSVRRGKTSAEARAHARLHVCGTAAAVSRAEASAARSIESHCSPLQLLQIVKRLHHFTVRLGQTRPRAFVAAPSQTAQQPRQCAFRPFFISQTVAEFVIGEQHAHIRRQLQRPHPVRRTDGASTDARRTVCGTAARFVPRRSPSQVRKTSCHNSGTGYKTGHTVRGWHDTVHSRPAETGQPL